MSGPDGRVVRPCSLVRAHAAWAGEVGRPRSTHFDQRLEVDGRERTPPWMGLGTPTVPTSRAPLLDRPTRRRLAVPVQGRRWVLSCRRKQLLRRIGAGRICNATELRFTTATLAAFAVLASPRPRRGSGDDIGRTVQGRHVRDRRRTPTVGVVLRDAMIIDLAAANSALELDPVYPHVPAPADMLELIGQYEYGLKYRIYEIVNNVVGNNLLGADYVHAVDDVDILPPILYPSKIMNAAVNFYTHACEGCTDGGAGGEDPGAAVRIGACRTCSSSRPAARSSAAAMTSSCPSVVTGSNGKSRWRSYSAARASTSRRPARTTTCSATWSRWTFPIVAGVLRAATAPVRTGSSARAMTRSRRRARGSFQRSSTAIRWTRLHQSLVIDGVTVQEARAGDMIHNIPELIEYASSLITVFPGDVLQSGTSGGTGAGRVERASGSGYLVDGESIAASIEGIGTLRHTVRIETSVPDDLSGSQLPPVRSYRGN